MATLFPPRLFSKALERGEKTIAMLQRGGDAVRRAVLVAVSPFAGYIFINRGRCQLQRPFSTSPFPPRPRPRLIHGSWWPHPTGTDKLPNLNSGGLNFLGPIQSAVVS